MNWLKLAGEIILPWLMSRLNKKKATRAEAITRTVIEGVEAYSKLQDKKDIKQVISTIAQSRGVQDQLKVLVDQYTKHGK